MCEGERKWGAHGRPLPCLKVNEIISERVVFERRRAEVGRLVFEEGGVSPVFDRRNVWRLNLLTVNFEEVNPGKPRLRFDLKR